MSKRIKRALAWIMALAMVVGFLPAQSASAAAKPNLNATKRTITIGDTATLKVQNKIAGSKYAWSSSNKKIATVTNSGVVTAVKKGNATVSCKVTAGKQTYNLKCAVTVSTEAVVSTQANLKKALKNDKVTKVTIKTSAAKKFNIPAGEYGKKTLVVNAPKSDVTNRGVFKSITIQAIKSNTWTERAVGNNIKVTASNASIVVGKEGNVASLNLAKNDANISVKVNGEVESLVVSREAKVDLTANGKVGEVELKAPAALTIEGKTEKIELVVSEAAKGAEVKTSVPLEAKVSASIDLKLEKGAEGSSVDKTSKDVEVKVDNQTSASVDVTTGGTDKQSVDAGKEGTVGGGDAVVIPPSSGGNDTPTPTPTPTPEIPVDSKLSDPISIPISAFIPSNALVGNGSFVNGTVTYGEGDVGYARAYISANIPSRPDNYPNLYSFTFSYQGPDRIPDPSHMVGGNVRLLAVTDSEATGDYMGGDSWIVDHTVGEVSITGATDVAKSATIEIDRKKLESLGDVTRLVLYVHSAIKTGGVSTSFTYSDISVVFAKDCCDGTCDPCDCVGYCKFDKEEGECCYVAPSETTEADCIEIDTADLHAVGATVVDGVITLTEQYEGYFVYFDVELPEGNTIYDYESLSASFKGISGDITYKPLKLSVGTPVDPPGTFASYTKIANEVANNLGVVTGTWSATFNFIDNSLKELQNESTQVVRFAINMHSAAMDSKEEPTVFEISDIKLNSKSCNDDNLCSVCTLPPLPGDNYTTTGSVGRYAPTKYGYDYEIWSQKVGNPPLAPGSATMNIPPTEAQAGKGGIFNATWRNTHNLLIRAGKKFTDGQGIKIGTVSTKGESYAGIGEIAIDFETDWATTDNVAYLGVYGWAFYEPESIPTEQESGIATEFSNEIEYYIVQDRKSYNPVEFANKRGEAVIDGILYDFYVTDRIGQPMLNSDSGNFKQYWSMPRNTADFRQSGTISVSEHFRAWEEFGMIMDGPLYEVALKVESYTGGYGANGYANVTKNILTINDVELSEPNDGDSKLSDPISIPISAFTPSNALNGKQGNGSFIDGTVTYGASAHSNAYIYTDIPDIPSNYPNLHSLTFFYQGLDRVPDPANPAALGGNVRLLAVDNSQATGGWMGDDAFVEARTIGQVSITGATEDFVKATIDIDKEKLASLGNVTRLVLYVHSGSTTNGSATTFTYSDVSVVFAADCCDGTCNPCECEGFCKFVNEGECCYVAPPATAEANCIEIGMADLNAVGATLNGGEVTLTAGYGGNFVYFDVTLPEGNTIYDYEGISFSLKGISGDNTYKILGLSAGAPKTPAGTFASYMPIANGVSNGFSQSTSKGGITFNFNDSPLQELYYAPTLVVRFAINMPAAVSNASGTTVFEISDIKLNSKSCDYINPCKTCYVPPLPGENYTASNGVERHAPEKYGYDYELWSQYGQGISILNIPPAELQAGNGGIFNGTWKDTHNVLIRAGKKFTDNKGIKVGTDSTPGESYKEIGEMVLEFETDWETTDNVAYLGVYGWAFYAPGSEPVEEINGNTIKFSNQIEYYIIQDRKSYNPVAGLTPKGWAEIDGIVYDFYVTNRINQPMLTGNGNFKQYWSVPRNERDYRQKGTISVSEHFRAWEEAGMLMNGPLYEVAWKVESYTGNAKGANGHAYVKKNILTINDVELSELNKPSGGDIPTGGSGGSPTPDLGTKETTNADGSTTTTTTTTTTDVGSNRSVRYSSEERKRGIRRT